MHTHRKNGSEPSLNAILPDSQPSSLLPYFLFLLNSLLYPLPSLPPYQWLSMHPMWNCHTICTVYLEVSNSCIYTVHVHVRDIQKEARSKQGQTNKAKKHSTPKAVTFQKEKRAASGGTRTHDTLHSRQSTIYHVLSNHHPGSS